MNNIKKKLCVTICNSWLVFDQSQPQLSYMRYISVGCVIGIIAGFCIGPGKKKQKNNLVSVSGMKTFQHFQTYMWLH